MFISPCCAHSAVSPLFHSHIPTLLTCGMRGAVGASGALARGGAFGLDSQLYSAGERPVTHLIGGRHFHQVDVPWLQVLQQSHSDAPCKRKHGRDR